MRMLSQNHDVRIPKKERCGDMQAWGGRSAVADLSHASARQWPPRDWHSRYKSNLALHHDRRNSRSPDTSTPAKNGPSYRRRRRSRWSLCRSHPPRARSQCPAPRQAAVRHLCLQETSSEADNSCGRFMGGNSTKATSGINGAGTQTQQELGIPDNAKIFFEDTKRSVSASSILSICHAWSGLREWGCFSLEEVSREGWTRTRILRASIRSVELRDRLSLKLEGTGLALG